DGVADDVALTRGEAVHDVAGRGLQRAALGRRGRSVHEIQPWAAPRGLCGRQYIDEAHLLADLLEIAERLLLDGGEAAGNVALGRLAVREIGGLVRLDHLALIRSPGPHELLRDLGSGRARSSQVLGAGELRSLAEASVKTRRHQLVVHV